MNILVLYDTKYGNTKKIAEAIGDAVSLNNKVDVIQATIPMDIDLQKYELLIVGSPTYGGRPSPPVKTFLDSIPSGALKGKNAVAFDTGSTSDGEGFIVKNVIKLFGYAAPRIAKNLKEKGANILASKDFFVKGMEGPIIEGEVERAKKWALDFIKN